MSKNVSNLVSNLDNVFGELTCKLIELEAFKTELSHIAVDVENTDGKDLNAMALRFYDIRHKIILLDSLMRYLVDDLERVYDDGYEIKKNLFKKFITGDAEVNE